MKQDTTERLRSRPGPASHLRAVAERPSRLHLVDTPSPSLARSLVLRLARMPACLHVCTSARLHACMPACPCLALLCRPRSPAFCSSRSSTTCCHFRFCFLPPSATNPLSCCAPTDLLLYRPTCPPTLLPSYPPTRSHSHLPPSIPSHPIPPTSYRQSSTVSSPFLFRSLSFHSSPALPTSTVSPPPSSLLASTTISPPSTSPPHCSQPPPR